MKLKVAKIEQKDDKTFVLVVLNGMYYYWLEVGRETDDIPLGTLGIE